MAVHESRSQLSSEDGIRLTVLGMPREQGLTTVEGRVIKGTAATSLRPGELVSGRILDRLESARIARRLEPNPFFWDWPRGVVDREMSRVNLWFLWTQKKCHVLVSCKLNDFHRGRLVCP